MLWLYVSIVSSCISRPNTVLHSNAWKNVLNFQGLAIIPVCSKISLPPQSQHNCVIQVYIITSGYLSLATQILNRQSSLTPKLRSCGRIVWGLATSAKQSGRHHSHSCQLSWYHDVYGVYKIIYMVLQSTAITRSYYWCLSPWQLL